MLIFFVVAFGLSFPFSRSLICVFGFWVGEAINFVAPVKVGDECQAKTEGPADLETSRGDMSRAVVACDNDSTEKLGARAKTDASAPTTGCEGDVA